MHINQEINVKSRLPKLVQRVLNGSPYNFYIYNGSEAGNSSLNLSVPRDNGMQNYVFSYNVVSSSFQSTSTPK